MPEPAQWSPERSPYGVRRFHPCPTCSTGEITPYALDGRGLSLLRELETWITEQGATAWPVAMHG